MPNQHSRRLAVVVVALGLMAGMAGCSSYEDSSDYVTGGDEGPSDREPAVQPPTDEEIQEGLGTTWDCYWDPSINDNWHDDVVCRKGLESFRPLLLPDAGFVTEDEMVAAGEAYEAQLNR